jgi:hypothetical protein
MKVPMFEKCWCEEKTELEMSISELAQQTCQIHRNVIEAGAERVMIRQTNKLNYFICISSKQARFISYLFFLVFFLPQLKGLILRLYRLIFYYILNCLRYTIL